MAGAAASTLPGAHTLTAAGAEGSAGAGSPASEPKEGTAVNHRIRWILLLAVPFLLVPSPRAQPAGTARAYAVDPLNSKLHIVLQRAGILAFLAHDHVLVARKISGVIKVHRGDITRSSLRFSFPVASLEVDPPEARAAEGLAGTLSESNRREVREQMLAADQLDQARFPRIVADTVAVEGSLPNLVLQLRLRIKNVAKVILVPAQVRIDAQGLRARGTMELLQSDFGIAPYSILLGSIAVEDRLRILFDITARPTL